MKNNEIKRLLRSEADNVQIPDVLTEIKKADLTEYKDIGTEIVSAHTPKISLRVKLLSGAAAVLLVILALIIVPSVSFDKKVYAEVALGAYTEFEITINKKEQVIDIKTSGDNAKKILENISYQKQPFDKTLTNLITACISEGYIISGEHITNRDIPIAVYCRYADGTARIRECIDEIVNSCCDKAQGE
ncbi:MAG: hypothetical protein LBT30_05130 [Clostridiales bacterium]|jgi:hypothetical protein|nr:hypothetical protein [Clostridiales bacterium]